MGRGWKAARAMFASNFCVNPPGEEEPIIGSDEIHTLEDLLALDAASSKSKSKSTRGRSASAGRRRSCLRIHKSTCSICLDPMAPGAGHALFTAECSHTFHFSCIASNVRHGNLICPVCRAKWVEVPWQQHPEFSKILASRRSSARNISGNQGSLQQHHQVDPVLRILNESIANAQRSRHRRGGASAEPAVYNDDEECLPSTGIQQQLDASAGAADDRRLKVSAFAENSSVAASESRDSFTVLVNIKAPSSSQVRTSNSSNHSPSPNRAPIDLVTVLDVSGSMAGSKLALLKSAMEFVIGHLSSRDRLSVIAFSTSATRLFPLKRMVEQGKVGAVRAVEALAASGGTNIGEALKKAVKILQERRWKNAVSSIMLLSDGQDTASSSSLFGGVSSAAASSSLSFLLSSSSLLRLAPVHAFGFGSDHDPTKMHAIAEATGGTFSFIRAESFVRDAFAQCIGGLLSVVSQGVEVSVSAGPTSARLLRIEQGGFTSRLSQDGSSAVISLGDLYAEEERDILLQIALSSSNSRPASSVEIARIQCSYRDALHPQELLQAEPVALSISRPEFVEESEKGTSLQVDKQRNRLLTSESIARAGILADSGDLGGAQAAIADARRRIEQSAAFLSGDVLSKSLHSELHEVLTRMENRRIYQESGRAYALSAHSSHYRQRATMRMDGDDDDDVYGHSYQTSSMAEMVHLSQSFSSTIGGHSNGGSHRSNSNNSSLVAKIGRSRSSRKVNPSSS